MTMLSRRDVFRVLGVTLISGRAHMMWAQNKTTPANKQGLVDVSAGKGSKALFLPPIASNDPVLHSLAENLFWTGIMMEHASFFVMMMPGPELASQRAQAEQFQKTFAAHLEKAMATTFGQANYAAFNRSTVDTIKPFVEFKQRLLDAQNSGRIHTLAWPLFFDHTIREAERGIRRLEQLATGDVALHYTEVVDFWADIMSDHGEFIGRLLDPQEEDLVSEALDSGAVFRGFDHGNQTKEIRAGEILIAAEDLIEFKTSVGNGVASGAIKSMMHPSLADHVRREALKFVDELKRIGRKT